VNKRNQHFFFSTDIFGNTFLSAFLFILGDEDSDENSDEDVEMESSTTCSGLL